MWNVKTRVIPVIIGATGTISISFRKYVSDIPGKPACSTTADSGACLINHIKKNTRKP